MKRSRACFRCVGVLTLAAVTALAVRADDAAGKVRLDRIGEDSTLPASPIVQASFESDSESEDTASDGADWLPPLEVELHQHGGSFLYEPLDVSASLYRPAGVHSPVLRLPADWQTPQPLSFPEDFLGSHLIAWDRAQSWFGENGAQWEPRFVAYGSYELFGSVLENAGRRRDGIGHQLIVDLDLALTGTERFHVQFRPLGGKNSGGSFLSFSEPTGYDDNADGVPQRWWFEGELQSLLGGLIDDPTQQWDVNVTLGKFPLALQNFLLMNDEVTGVILSKNNLLIAPFSNINVQMFYLLDDVDAFNRRSTEVVGLEVTADYRLAFLEATYLHTFDASQRDVDADYFALAGTQFFGPITLAGRVLLKTGNSAGSGDGQLYVIESNFTRRASPEVEERTGIELAVAYVNLFKATSGWSPVAGGNFDRLRNAFALNPLLQIAGGRAPTDTTGGALGVQLFRHHEDESIIPEVALEDVAGDSVWGAGLQYERKLSPRVYFNLRGLKTWSDNRSFVRAGVFVSTFLIF